MNILVCFKAVANLDMLSADNWVVDSDLSVNVNYVPKMLNCFDESALEMTLKLSNYLESFNVLYKTTALTIGDKKSDNFLKTLNALRFTKTVRIENDQDIRFTPISIAQNIAQYVKKIEQQDVIIMGSMSGEGDNAQTPLYTSEMLGIPCITEVIDFKYIDEKKIQVTSTCDDGILEQVVRLPIVIAIGNAPNSYMRVPTLKDKMSYGKRDIAIIDFDYSNYENTKLVSLNNKNSSRENIEITGDSIEEKAENLYWGYLKGRFSKL